MLPMLRRKSFMPGFDDEFFGKDFLAEFFNNRKDYTMPAVNIVEDKDDFRIEVAAPGLSKKEIKMNVENNVLTISSEKEEKSEESNEKYMIKEFSYSSFSRSFTLSDKVDADKVSATYKDGVLNVIIPKKEEAKEKPAREIKIS